MVAITQQNSFDHRPLAQDVLTDGPIQNIEYYLKLVGFSGIPSGLLASRPAPGNVGAFYYATDTGIIYYDNGTAWVTAFTAGAQLNVANTWTANQTLPVIDSGGEVFDIRAYGSIATDASAAIVAAHNAAVTAGGGVVLYPSGIIPIIAGVTLLGNSVIHRGQGMYATTLQMQATPGSVTLITAGQLTTPVEHLVFEDMGFDAAATTQRTKACLNITGAVEPRVTRCRFYRAPFAGITLGNCTGFTVENCLFQDSMVAPPNSVAINLEQSSNNGTIRGNRFHYVQIALSIVGGNASQSDVIENVRILDNYFDLGWYTLPAVASNSGATVTYTAGANPTLVDTAATFTSLGLATNSTQYVRAMPTLAANSGSAVTYDEQSIYDTSHPFASRRRNGKAVASSSTFTADGTAAFTAANTPAGTPILITGAGVAGADLTTTCTYASTTTVTLATAASTSVNPAFFTLGATLTNAIVPGDLVRTATGKFGVVSECDNPSLLHVEEWLDNATRDFVLQPAAAEGYTVYRAVILPITTVTSATVLTSNALNYWDRVGNVATPSAGTYYEITEPTGSYPIYVDGYCRDILIQGNTFKRAFGDNVEHSVMCERVTTDNNRFFDCYDTEVFLQGSDHTCTNNVFVRSGKTGLASGGWGGHVIANNRAYDCVISQIAGVTNSLGAFQAAAPNCTWVNNYAERIWSQGSFYGYYINGLGTPPPINNTMIGNTSINALTADWHMASGANITGLKMLSNTGVWDTTGIDTLGLASATNPVNGLLVTSAATGTAPILSSAGKDTNIGITLTPKGTGGLFSTGVFFPVQAPTASAPAYVLGGMYFDTTLNKLRIGGVSAWETVTSA